MRTAYVDVDWSHATDEDARTPRNLGWVSYSGPRAYPYPGFLSAAKLAAEAEDDVVFQHVTAADLADPSRARRALEGFDRIVVCAPAMVCDAAERFAADFEAGGHARPELFDPYLGGRAMVLGYGMATGVSRGRAEVDVLPPTDPVHPWVCDIVQKVPAKAWEQRLDAILASCGTLPEGEEKPIWQAPEADLYLNDHRVPLDMDRVRAVARGVSRGLRQHHTMFKLHFRAWPRDLLDSRLLDHLTCLPIGSLEVLVGSVRPESLDGREQASSPEHTEKVLAAMESAGLAHITGLSVVMGLPGETAEDCIQVLDTVLKSAVDSKIRRIRVAYWLGDGVVPKSAAEQRELFFRSHPDWHPMEYEGLYDFLAVLRSTAPQLELLGPGFLPEWGPAAPDGP